MCYLVAIGYYAHKGLNSSPFSTPIFAIFEGVYRVTIILYEAIILILPTYVDEDR